MERNKYLNAHDLALKARKSAGVKLVRQNNHHLISDFVTSTRSLKAHAQPKHQTITHNSHQNLDHHGSNLSTKVRHLPSKSIVLKRQTVQKVQIAHKYSKQSKMPMILSSLAVFLFVLGIVTVIYSLHSNQTVKAQVKQITTKQNSSAEGPTTEVPSEDSPPDPNAIFSVAPDLPKRIFIDKIGVSARVIRVGVTNENVLKAPTNIFDTGWYDESAKPGEAGAVVIDGHVSGPTKHGVFYDVKTLAKGDKLKLERGDGKIFGYTVVGTQVYDSDNVDMTKVMTSVVAGKPGLNLITCAGKFNSKTNTFEQRVVVFTVQD